MQHARFHKAAALYILLPTAHRGADRQISRRRRADRQPLLHKGRDGGRYTPLRRRPCEKGADIKRRGLRRGQGVFRMPVRRGRA